MHAKNLLPLISLCLLSSCGWVDSTGRSSNSTPVTQISFNDGQQSSATQINELSSLRIRADSTDSDGTISSYKWSDQPVEQGKLSQCVSESVDFDANIAANSLQEACASPDNCRVRIEQQADSPGESADYIVSVPDLRAPVGVTFELQAIDNDGGIGTQRSTFCLIAINTAPEAIDDSFTVLEGETLEVKGDSQRTLLSNDSDDNHVLNSALTVNTEAKRAPANASFFRLDSNGGFVYRPISGSLSDDATDSFEYWISDGVHDPVSATVTLRIVAKDDAPEQVRDIAALQAVPGIGFEFDLNPYFKDPEGGDLSFAVVGGSLPASGKLVLSSTGILSGSAELFDQGTYNFDIAASDGSSGVVSSLELSVINNFRVLGAPIETQLNDAGEELVLNVSSYFDDPENQALSYAVNSSFADAQLSMNESSGVLTAVFSDGGRFTIDVSADDGVNTPTTIRFSVVVTLDNANPTFRGAIEGQVVDLGDAIEPISGIFRDPDGDELEYSLVGSLPPGLIIDTSTGVLSGTPTQAGRFPGLRIVASDVYGEFARSNAFSITVVAVPANSAPEYVDDTVFNQGIALGMAIRTMRPEFMDADGDELVYSIKGGPLPAGVTIDSATGVISGRPTLAGWRRDLQVVATDEAGLSAESDEFWIRVR